MRKGLPLLLILLVSYCAAGDKKTAPGPLHLDKDGEKWVQKTLKKMTLEQKVGQMFMIWSRAQFYNVNSPDYLKMADAVKRYHLGGFGLTVMQDGPFLLKNEPYEAAIMTNRLQREAEIPLIFAADFERGLSMRLNGVTAFPHAMAFGATGNPQYANDFGRITAEEARAIGVDWNFFPDADVNSNPANPIINTRSFGEDPAQVSQFVTAYILGARASGMMTTAKHFPGHGDTDTDSHLALARVTGDINRLEHVELEPFREAIEAGVDSIMVGHLITPALDPDPNHVASISPEVITGLLKGKMGFRGIVVTDALEMNGLMKLFQPGTAAVTSAKAAVAAVKAGEDMILIPADIEGAYNGVLQAVRGGEIPESRIDESVRKILEAKASLGLNKHREVDIKNLDQVIARTESLALAQKIADDAVTLVRDNGQVLPLVPKIMGTPQSSLSYQPEAQSANRTLAIIFTDDMRSDSGRMFETQLRKRIPDVHIEYVDRRTATALTPQLLQAAAEAKTVVAAVYAIPSAGRQVNGGAAGSIGLAEGMGNLLNSLVGQYGAKTVVVTMGNPYFAADYPQMQTYLCTFSNATVSELSAVKALFGEIPIHGHMPVSIPEVAQRGAGIERPARVFTAGGSNDGRSFNHK
ncbi:MAG: glycoside hydrolase family 3 protein [Acidobacteriaceae bacterium]